MTSRLVRTPLAPAIWIVGFLAVHGLWLPYHLAGERHHESGVAVHSHPLAHSHSGGSPASPFDPAHHPDESGIEAAYVHTHPALEVAGGVPTDPHLGPAPARATERVERADARESWIRIEAADPVSSRARSRASPRGPPRRSSSPTDSASFLLG